FNAKEKREVLEKLKPYVSEEPSESFGGGRTPGAPSRWSAGKDLAWVKVTPKFVCEVRFDYMQGDRMRHAAGFLRWREDKAPEQCTYDQLEPPNPFALEKIIRLGAKGLGGS